MPYSEHRIRNDLAFFRSLGYVFNITGTSYSVYRYDRFIEGAGSDNYYCRTKSNYPFYAEQAVIVARNDYEKIGSKRAGGRA